MLYIRYIGYKQIILYGVELIIFARKLIIGLEKFVLIFLFCLKSYAKVDRCARDRGRIRAIELNLLLLISLEIKIKAPVKLLG